MIARPRRSFGREILALALSAVVFLAAVAASRLQGGLAAQGAFAAGILCLSGEGDDGAPGKASPPHQHCTLCAFAAVDCGATHTTTLHRVTSRDSAQAHGLAAVIPAGGKNFEARGPPARA